MFLGKIDEDITCFILVRKFLLADELLLGVVCLAFYTHTTCSKLPDLHIFTQTIFCMFEGGQKRFVYHFTKTIGLV